ncbi:putative entry exclusion protein TrbK-alt [Tistlia consotensis]|uniref:putative entry exclusion protein TrbK-alt n=1 Tax=Tistlia consotensis TaxID=1321365 RepID=UPI000A15631C|nr:putative entry exclusion protein TrbK-alt [Tistlia consotensis]
MFPINPGRLIALTLLATAVVASTAACSRHQSRQSSPAPAAAISDELERCRQLGVDAERDPACRAAWEKNWQHFMGGKPSKGGK